MLSTTKKLLTPLSSVRHFAYSIKENDKLRSEINRKVNVLQMFTKYKDYNHKEPTMSYDSKTGEVTIKEANQGKKRIIRDIDEISREKAKLYEELGLDSGGMPIGQDPEDVDKEQLSEKLRQVRD